MSLLSGFAQNEAPKGKLVYCSYSCRRPAMGGNNYCELIADSGAVPKVRVVLWENCRWHDEVKQEFTVGQQDVAKMQRLLKDIEIWKLNGYHHDEMLDGAPTYRIYQEYSSGEKFNASWVGHDIKGKALDAYAAIEDYFSLWREMVESKAEQ